MTPPDRPATTPAVPAAPVPAAERESVAPIPAGQRDPRLATEWHV